MDDAASCVCDSEVEEHKWSDRTRRAEVSAKWVWMCDVRRDIMIYIGVEWNENPPTTATTTAHVLISIRQRRELCRPTWYKLLNKANIQ